MKSRYSYARAVTIEGTKWTDSEGIIRDLVLIIPQPVIREGVYSQSCLSREGGDYLRRNGFEKMAFFGYSNVWVANRTSKTLEVALGYEKAGYLYDEEKHIEAAKIKQKTKAKDCSNKAIIEASKKGKFNENQKRFLRSKLIEMKKLLKLLDKVS